MRAPLTEDEKYIAAWHHIQAAINVLPSSGSVSVGPPLTKLEEAKEDIQQNRERLQKATQSNHE